MNHWLDYWDYLDQNFWAYCRWFGKELTPDQLAWRPAPEVASIGWNIRHLGEMLDHYLAKVFRYTQGTVAHGVLSTMVEDSRDDGRFGDLQATMDYHRTLRPTYRRFLTSLKSEDLDRPLTPGPGTHTMAWAIGHIAEHESYHFGKCTLLRKLLQARRQ